MNNRKLKLIIEGIAGAVSIAVTILLSPLLRPWYRCWGASDEEARRGFPGDEFVPRPKSELTMAISVRAPAKAIWPWLGQIGCQRGGWYSYDLLDNGGAPSADRILTEYQDLKVGDIVKAMPKGDFGFPVALIRPGQALVLAGTLDTRTGQPANPNDPGLMAYFSGDQTFYIEERSDGISRLIFRMRIDWNPSLANKLIYGYIVEPISFVMGRKTLMNVKRRAEGYEQN
jgi:proline iminopeptidase